MKLLLIVFFFYTVTSQAADFVEEMNNINGHLRAGSSDYLKLKEKAEALSTDEILKTAEELKGVKLKNFLFLVSTSGERKSRLQLFLTLLEKDKENSVLSYFTSRLYKASDAESLMNRYKSEKESSFLFPVLASSPSSKAFKFLYQKYKENPDAVNSTFLVNTVTRDNISQVLELSGDLFITLGTRIAGSKKGENEGLLRARLNSIKNSRPVVFSQEEKKELTQIYAALNGKSLEEFLKNDEQKVFDDKYSPALTRKLRSSINLQDPLIRKVFYARLLNFSYENFKKHHPQIDGLYSASIEMRLKALLSLKDAKDPDLAPVFMYLLKDPASEIRRDSMDALTVMSREENDLNIDAGTIISYLKDPSEEVILAAIILLTELDDSNANLEIIKITEHENVQIKLAAIESIERNAVEGGLNCFFTLMNDSRWNVRARVVKALKAYKRKVPNFLTKLESAFLKETDPYVRNGLLTYVKSSQNPKIYEMLKASTVKDGEVNFEAYTNLLQMDAIRKEDIEAGRKYFSLDYPQYSAYWLSAASSVAIGIKEELKLVFKEGGEYLVSRAVDFAAANKMNLLETMTDQAFRHVSAYDLCSYMKEAAFISSAQRVLLFKKLLNDKERTKMDGVLSYVNDLIHEDPEELSSRDLRLTAGEKSKVKGIIKGNLGSYKNAGRIYAFIILERQFEEKEFLKMLSFKSTSYYAKYARIKLIKSMKKEQVAKYEKQIIDVLKTVHYYQARDALNKLSPAGVIEVYNHTELKNRGELLVEVAHLLPEKVVREDIKFFQKNKQLQSYEIAEIIKLLLSKGDRMDLVMDLIQTTTLDSWTLREITQSIPASKKVELIKGIRSGKIKLTAGTLSFVADKLEETDFKLVKEYLIHNPLPEVRNFEKINVRLSLYLKGGEVTSQKLKILKNAFPYLRVTPDISKRLMKAAVKMPRQDQETAFEWMEKSGYTQEEYFDIYIQLLSGTVSGYFFKGLAANENDDEMRMFMRMQQSRRSFRRSSSPSAVPEKYRKPLSSAIKRIMTVKRGAERNEMIKRLGSVEATGDWLLSVSKYLKADHEILEFIPEGRISSDDFKALEKIIPVSSLSLSLASQLAYSISPETVKDLIIRYRKNADNRLLVMTMNHFGESEADLTADITVKFMRNFNLSHDQLSSNTSNLIRNLESNAKVKEAVNKEFSKFKLSAEDILYLSIMGFSPGEDVYNRLLKTKLDYNAAESLLQASYMSGVISKGILELHEKSLLSSDGEDLIQLIKLGTSNTLKHQKVERFDHNDRKSSLIYTFNSRYRYSDEPIKNHSIPESLDAEFLKVINAKKAGVAKLKDKSLNVYISNAARTLKEILEELESEDSPIISRLHAESISKKLKKADKETFDIFMKILKNENLKIDGKEVKLICGAFSNDQMQLISTWVFSKGDSAIKNLFSYNLAAKVSTPEAAASILKNYLKSDVKWERNELNEMFYYGESSPIEHYQKAAKSVFAGSDFKLDDKLLYLVLTLRVDDHGLALQIDEKYPELNEELQSMAKNFLFSAGPYYKNVVTEYLKAIKPIKEITEENLRELYYDIYFVWRENYTFDPKKAEGVKSQLGEITALKRKLYDKADNKSKILLIMFHDKELILKEVPKFIDQLSPQDTVLLDHFSEPEREKLFKKMYDKFKSSRGNYMLRKYITSRKLKYKWIPAEDHVEIEEF